MVDQLVARFEPIWDAMWRIPASLFAWDVGLGHPRIAGGERAWLDLRYTWDRRHVLGESAPAGVELEPDQLSESALRGLVEEFVTREGTDYGLPEGLPEGLSQRLPEGLPKRRRSETPRGIGRGRGDREPEWSLEEKVAQVYRQLERGEARIVFDLETETASIVSTRESTRARS